MMLTGAVAVYVLGLRHGADPDHLAAIDNLTRNSVEQTPRLSRFVGSLFACGHTVMLLAIAGLVGLLGSRFAQQGPLLERTGTWISIALLLLLAAFNLRQLSAGKTEHISGFKTRFLPAVLRNATSPWAAIPIGLLFGFGFETSSQVAAYAIAFGSRSGVTGAIAAASLFCLGMLCSDTLDSLVIHRLISYRSAKRRLSTRLWVWSISVFAVVVAMCEFFWAC
jgi:nickel/cobalt transporter (NiCoT) family protein